MVNLFRPKTMRRMAVFAALVAPIVYLFGSLFTALAGAHGSQVFAGSSESPSVTLSIHKGFGINADGDVYPLSTAGVTELFYVDGVGGDFSFSSDVTYGQLKVIQYDVDGVYLRGTAAVNGFYTMPVDVYSFRLEFWPVDSNGFVVVTASNGFSANLDAVGYSEYVFGQFFAKDNFLVQWGRDAISDNAPGFAPFGHFWRYLDTYILHLSNEQVGLMAYGYMYYAAHVLLFDVGFMLVTFFLSFIQKVGDKIGGEER